MKTISIIVPAHNEEKSISPCISSLLDIDYPKHLYEIIVVLDGCTDSTYDVLKKFKNKIKIINLKENHGPAEARNIGSKNSKSEIICFIDGDCKADKKWLKEIVKCFQSLEVVVVAGRTNPDFKPNTLFKKYIYNGVILSERFYGAKEETKIIDKEVPSLNMSFKRDVFSKIGGFKKEFKKTGEDAEICIRLIESGFHIAYAPKAIVFNSYLRHVSSFRHFIKKRIEYGIGWAQIAAEHPKNMKKIRLLLNCFFNLVYYQGLWFLYYLKKRDVSMMTFPFFSFFEVFLNLMGVLSGCVRFS